GDGAAAPGARHAVALPRREEHPGSARRPGHGDGGVAKHFAGPTAVAFNQTDPVGLAKVLTNFAKTNPNLVFKGALIDGRPIEVSEIKTIAELPTREALLGRLLFILQSPLTRLATVLAGPVSNLARVLRAVAEKSRSGPADAAPAS